VKVFAELVDTIATSHGGKQIFSVKPTAKLIADLSCSAVSQRRLYWHEAVFTRSYVDGPGEARHLFCVAPLNSENLIYSAANDVSLFG
jgi:hypothetical protein